MTLDDIRRTAMAALRPPQKVDLAHWVEAHVRLPPTVAAESGLMRLWPHQRDIARSIGDPNVERVSVLKSARVGYSQLLTAAIGAYSVNDPAPVLVVLPAEADCRLFVTANVEPTFAASSALRAVLTENPSDRDTMLQRSFPGGSLVVTSARAPRNLRARTARVLILDEIDAFEVTTEGDPVALAERRTFTFADRKIIAGSTPIDEATSAICRLYGESDQRVYRCPCPACGTPHEIRWQDIHWPEGEPENAHWACPSCGGVVEEAGKRALVEAGAWHVTRPEAIGHHGYRLNSLISLLPNAAWGKLAKEFVAAKRSPDTLKPFVNTVLGEPWRDNTESLDDVALSSRREPIGMDNIPPEVLFLTCGVDVQADRIEATTLGWAADGTIFALEHVTLWGSPHEPDVWEALDDHLKREWRHPRGGRLRIDATLIDSGDGGTVDRVYDFCRPRIGRRVFACKGAAGFKRPAVQLSNTKKIRLQIVGVDNIKSQIYNRLQAGLSIRFSDSLSGTWFEQLAAERIVVKYSRGQPIRAFERIPGRRSEALDCVAYAWAARPLISVAVDRRESELASVVPPKRRTTVIRSAWLDGSS